MTTLETLDGFQSSGMGAAVQRGSGESRLAWRVSLQDPTGRELGIETHAAHTRSVGGPTPLAPSQRDEGEDATRPAPIALVETRGGALITGRLTAAGLVLQADEGEETLLPFDIGSTRTLESAELDGGHLVAMVEEQSSPGFRRTTAAVIDSAFSEVARAVVFDGPPSVATLLVMGADIYVARFERLFERLDGSRLRIARLDRALARVEPDRALDGWGGLGPTAIALVPWQDAPWLIWHTIDVRFGANPVLYALPLTEDACAGSVDRPLVVLSDTSATAPYAPMRVATDDIHLWIVTAAHSAGPLLRSYRLARCR